MKKTYPISAYDKYLCLKPDISMLLVSAFLLRPFFIIVLSVANLQDKTGLIDFLYPDRLTLFLNTFAAIPAAFVAFVFIKRVPDATDKARWIWRRGRELLLASTFLNIATVFAPVLAGVTRTIETPGWVQIAICALIILYLFRSQRVRDTFADFPFPGEADKK